jgi:hypothetical protein
MRLTILTSITVSQIGFVAGQLRTRHNKVRLGEKQKGVKRDGGNGEHDDRREDQSAVEETGVSCGVKRVHLRLAHEENTSPNETFEQLISARADVKQTRNLPPSRFTPFCFSPRRTLLCRVLSEVGRERCMGS